MATPIKVSEMTAATSLTGSELIPIVQSGVNKSATPTLIAGLASGSRAYGVSVDQATQIYTQLGVSGRVVHDRIRQCIQNDDGTINYWLDKENGWNKESHKPVKRFADKAQSGAVIDNIVSLDAFREVVAGQGVSNRRGE
jgi:hypothetical protein